eukprot:scaffold64935_cov32-Phaeocystis_antarctica.AAC.1
MSTQHASNTWLGLGLGLGLESGLGSRRARSTRAAPAAKRRRGRRPWARTRGRLLSRGVISRAHPAAGGWACGAVGGRVSWLLRGLPAASGDTLDLLRRIPYRVAYHVGAHAGRQRDRHQVAERAGRWRARAGRHRRRRCGARPVADRMLLPGDAGEAHGALDGAHG